MLLAHGPAGSFPFATSTTTKGLPKWESIGLQPEIHRAWARPESTANLTKMEFLNDVAEPRQADRLFGAQDEGLSPVQLVFGLEQHCPF